MTLEQGQLLDAVGSQLVIRQYNRQFLPEQSGEGELSPTEFIALTVYEFHKELFINGFDGFVYNTDGSFADFLPVALNAIGTHRYALLARLAWAQRTDTKGLFDSRFFELFREEPFDELLHAYVQRHRNELPDGATGGRGSDTQRPPVNPREGNRPNGRETPPPGTAQLPAGPGSSSPNGSSSGPSGSQRPIEPGGASEDDPDAQVPPSTEPEAEESNAGKVLFEGDWIEAAAKQKLQEAYAQRAHAELVKFILEKLGDAAAPSDYRSDDTKVTPSAEANTFIVSVTYFDPATKKRKKCFATIRRSDDSRWSVKGNPL